MLSLDDNEMDDDLESTYDGAFPHIIFNTAAVTSSSVADSRLSQQIQLKGKKPLNMRPQRLVRQRTQSRISDSYFATNTKNIKKLASTDLTIPDEWSTLVDTYAIQTPDDAWNVSDAPVGNSSSGSGTHTSTSSLLGLHPSGSDLGNPSSLVGGTFSLVSKRSELESDELTGGSNIVSAQGLHSASFEFEGLVKPKANPWAARK